MDRKGNCLHLQSNGIKKVYRCKSQKYVSGFFHDVPVIKPKGNLVKPSPLRLYKLDMNELKSLSDNESNLLDGRRKKIRDNIRFKTNDIAKLKMNLDKECADEKCINQKDIIEKDKKKESPLVKKSILSSLQNKKEYKA